MARKKQWDWRAGLVGTSRRRGEPFPTLVDVEIVHIDRVLQAYGYNFVRAAIALGISRATLYRKMHRELEGTKEPSKARPKLRASAG
jgi:DNA-binding NtrC family response regulator